MATKTAKNPVKESTGFPVTLEEFLQSLPRAQAETKAGFKSLCKTEQINGNKTADAWQKLYAAYQTKPIKKKWSDHLKEGGK